MPERWERKTVVPPAQAIAWWHDLREDDHPDSVRRIVERSADLVVAEDVHEGVSYRSTSRRVAPTELAVAIDGPGFQLRATMRAVPDGAGSRLLFERRVERRGLARLLAPLRRKARAARFEADMARHVAQMERGWSQQPW